MHHFPMPNELSELTEREQDALTCARRGLEWLDANIPEWRTNVDLATLELSDCNACVLAQAAQVWYHDAAIKYDLSPSEQVALGFQEPIYPNDKATYGSFGYRELQAAWEQILA